MPVDMKEIIARAALTLLTERKTRKLTVKNIVEECHITRQTFYYHFEDIPHLFCWMLEQGIQKAREEAPSLKDPEPQLRYFFLVALNTMPYVKKGLESNYGRELEKLLKDHFYQMFSSLIEREDLYRNHTRSEVKLILRYHCYAIMGLLQDWTPEDTENLDQIVHLIFLLITEGISPLT